LHKIDIVGSNPLPTNYLSSGGLVRLSMFKTYGIVTRYTNYRDYDRILTLFSRDKGKIQAVARGCRRPKSNLLAASQVFCYGEFLIYAKQGKYTITQCEVLDSFYNLRTELDAFAYAAYILNLCEEAINPDEGNPFLFQLLLNSLSFLSYSDMNPLDISLIFTVKYLDNLGYRPELQHCVNCGREINKTVFFSPYQGGVLCEACNNRDFSAYTIHRGTIETIKYILWMELSKMNTLRMGKEIRDELKMILKPYLQYRMEKHFKSADFIEQIEKLYRKEG